MQHFNYHFFGYCTVGEKGQVVIPVKARKEMGLNSADQLVFFGNDKILHIIKASEVDEMLKTISDKFNLRMEKIRKVVEQGGKDAK